MRHRKYTFKIGRTGSHRRAMMANLVSSLIKEGRVKTTLTKGKQLRRFADRMVTLGKKGTLAARRQAAAMLNQADAVQALFEDVAKTMAERQGGYTRVLKLGKRRGDAAEMCLVELVTEPVESKKKPAKKSEEPASEPVEEAAAPVAKEAVAEEKAEEPEAETEAEEAAEAEAEEETKQEEPEAEVAEEEEKKEG
jgi:large subunit ribosomal protein L17